MKPAQFFFSQGTENRKLGRKPPDVLIMDNLETPLATTLDKSHEQKRGDIVERLIKPIASTMFGHPVYLLDGPGP